MKSREEKESIAIEFVAGKVFGGVCERRWRRRTKGVGVYTVAWASAYVPVDHAAR